MQNYIIQNNQWQSPELFCKKFCKIHRKTSDTACDFTKKRLPHRCFLGNFADLFKNILFTEHFRAAVSECCTIGTFYPELNHIRILRGQLLLATVSLKNCFQLQLFNILSNLWVFGPANSLKRDSNTEVFCKICEIFKNAYFEEHLRMTTASVFLNYFIKTFFYGCCYLKLFFIFFIYYAIFFIY